MLPHLRGGPCAGVRSSCSESAPTRAGHRRSSGLRRVLGRALPRSGVSWFIRFVGKKTPRYLRGSYATTPLGIGVVSPCGSALSRLYAFCRGQRFPVGYQDLTARSIQFADTRILYGITKHKTLNKPLYPLANSNRSAPSSVSRARNHISEVILLCNLEPRHSSSTGTGWPSAAPEPEKPASTPLK